MLGLLSRIVVKHWFSAALARSQLENPVYTSNHGAAGGEMQGGLIYLICTAHVRVGGMLV